MIRFHLTGRVCGIAEMSSNKRVEKRNNESALLKVKAVTLQQRIGESVVGNRFSIKNTPIKFTNTHKKTS